jgi:hypothetical protein
MWSIMLNIVSPEESLMMRLVDSTEVHTELTIEEKLFIHSKKQVTAYNQVQTGLQRPFLYIFLTEFY